MTAPTPSDATAATPETAAPAVGPGQTGGVDAVSRVKSLWTSLRRWVRRDAKRAIRYAIVGAVISWLGNVIVIAAVYNGVSKVPPGAGVTAPSTVLTGILFWTLAMALVFGAFEYARAVGSKRFWADVRGFPTALLSLFRADGNAARIHLLWGFAGAMLVAAALSGGVAFVIGVTWLALLAAVLRPILTGLLMVLWRKVVGAFSKQHATPPPPNAFAVSAIGIVLALVGAYLLPTAPVKVAVAVGAGALAFVLSRTGTPAAGATTAALVVAAVSAWLTILVQPALGHDGGFSECGGSWAAWLGCSGTGEVLQSGLLGGVFGGAGGVLGGGLGDGLGKDRVRRGWGASLDGSFDGFMDQLLHQAKRDVADPLSILAALGGAPDEALVTDSSRAMRDFMNSGEARSLYEEFAADPLEYAKKHGITDWVRDFPTSDHGMNEQAEQFKALYGEYQQAVQSGDDYNANRLRGMLGATAIWLGAQFVDPEMAVEGVAGRFGTKTVAGGLERTATGLAGRELVAIEQIEKGGVNQSMRVVFDDGGRAILKPDAGTRNTLYEQLLTGPKSSREVGTYVTDRHLGFNQVPETIAIDDPNFGRSALQEWRDSKTTLDLKAGGTFYPKDEQMMAVRDYITGNHDRHYGNVLMSPEGGMIAIDHGESFPTGIKSGLLKNEFLVRQIDQPLDASIVEAARAVDQTALRADLKASGLSPQQIDGAIARLNEVATNGRITGAAIPQGQEWTIMSSQPGFAPVLRPPAP